MGYFELLILIITKNYVAEFREVSILPELGLWPDLRFVMVPATLAEAGEPPILPRFAPPAQLTAFQEVPAHHFHPTATMPTEEKVRDPQKTRCGEQFPFQLFPLRRMVVTMPVRTRLVPLGLRNRTCRVAVRRRFRGATVSQCHSTPSFLATICLGANYTLPRF